MSSTKGQSSARAQRRSHLHKNRFHGESKNVHLTVTQTAKYKRRTQLVELFDDNGNVKRKNILHYDKV